MILHICLDLRDDRPKIALEGFTKRSHGSLENALKELQKPKNTQNPRKLQSFTNENRV